MNKDESKKMQDKIGYLRFILNIILVTSILFGVTPVIYALVGDVKWSKDLLFVFIFKIPVFLGYGYAVINLKKILKSLSEMNPFNKT